MKVILTNGYYIEIDGLNHTLKQKYIAEKKNDKSKYETEKVCGYYNNLAGAVEKFIKLNQIDLMAQEAFEMSEYVKSIEEINKTAIKAIKSVLEGEHTERGCNGFGSSGKF